MSERRQARERDMSEAVEATGGVPAALQIGACIEVWADPKSQSPSAISAWRRYSMARNWWLESAGLDDQAEATDLFPGRSPWCFAHLSYIGQAERVGRPVDEIVDEMLTSVGVTRADVHELRVEAQALYRPAKRAEKARHSRRPTLP